MPSQPPDSGSQADASADRTVLILRKIVTHNDLVSKETFKKYRVLQKKARKYGVHLSLSDILYHRDILSEKQFHQVQDHLEDQYEEELNLLPLCMKYESLSRDDLPEELMDRNVCTESQVQATNTLKKRIDRLGISIPWGIIFVNNENISPEFVEQALKLQKRESRTEEDTGEEGETLETTFGKLAVENEVVTEEQLKEALATQEEILKEDDYMIPLGEIFEKKGFASEEVIESLLEIQDELRDNRDELASRSRPESDDPAEETTLGKLALQNGLISEEEHERVLEIQENLDERGIHKQIGEILTEKEFIGEDVLDALLRIQQSRRGLGSKSDYLPDDESSRSDQSIRRIETVLGRLAVSNELVTQEQLNEALQIQSNLKEDAYLPLGEILVKRGFTSEDALKALLDMQKVLREEDTEMIVGHLDRPSLQGDAGSVLGELAVRNGLVTEEQLQEAIQLQEKMEQEGIEKPLGEILLDEGYINEQTLESLLHLQETKRELEEQEQQEDDRESTDETSSAFIDPREKMDEEEGMFQRLDALSEFDHQLLNELKDRNKIAESQIPLILEKQSELKQKNKPDENALYGALIQLGAVTEEELSRILSTTLEQSKQEESEEQTTTRAATIVGFLVLGGTMAFGGIAWYLNTDPAQTSRTPTIKRQQNDSDATKNVVYDSTDEQNEETPTNTSPSRPKQPEKLQNTNNVADQISARKVGENRVSIQLQGTLPDAFPRQPLPIDVRIFYEGKPLPGSSSMITTNNNGVFKVPIGPFMSGGSNNQLPPGLYIASCQFRNSPLSLPDSVRFAAESYGAQTNWLLDHASRQSKWTFFMMTSLGDWNKIRAFHTDWVEFAQESYQKLQTPVNVWADELRQDQSRDRPDDEFYKKLVQKIQQRSRQFRAKLKKQEQQYYVLPFSEPHRRMQRFLRVLPHRVRAYTAQLYAETTGNAPNWLQQQTTSGAGKRSLKDGIRVLQNQLEEMGNHIPSGDPNTLLTDRVEQIYRFSAWRMIRLKRLFPLLEDPMFVREAFPNLQEGRTNNLLKLYRYGMAYILLQGRILDSIKISEEQKQRGYSRLPTLLARRFRNLLSQIARDHGDVPPPLQPEDEQADDLDQKLENTLNKLNLRADSEPPSCHFCPSS